MGGTPTQRLVREASLVLLAAAGFAAWLWWEPTGGAVSEPVSLAMQTLVPALAGAACWDTARRRSGRARRSWQLLGAAAASWAVGNAMWSVTGQTEGASLAAAGADLAFLALFPLALAGLLVHPLGPRGPWAMAQLVLDGLVAGGAIHFAAWVLVLHRVSAAPGAGRFENVVGFAQAVGDFVLVTVALLIVLGATSRRGPMALIAAGFAAVGIGDGIFTYLVVDGRYATGSMVDALWVFGFVALALAARWEAAPPAVTGEHERRRDGILNLLLPYFLVVPAFALGGFEVLDGGHLDVVLAWNGIAVALLVLMRQMVERVHSARLVRSLERTVAELRTRDDQLAEAQRIARLGSWEWEARSQRVTRTDEVLRMFGVDPGTEVPERQGLLLHVHPDDRERVQHAVARALESGSVFDVDFRPALVEGRVIHGRGRVVRDGNGKPARMVGTAQDVTTVRHLERELQHRLAELERSNADLAHFASVASHDLAAPVQLLLGHLSILSRRVRDRGDRADAELIQGAVRGAQRLEELIQDILAYSLATTGESELRVPVDTERVAREAARSVGSERRHARIEYGHLPVIDAHPGQVRQLFANLLSNALKFVPAGRRPEIRIWAERAEGGWRFSVADNGVGVPEHERERIFQMFQRADGLGAHGAGIGLAICTRIVARHGGRLWAAPNPDGGSVFSFTFPTDVEARMPKLTDRAGA